MDSYQTAALSISAAIVFTVGVLFLWSGYYKGRSKFTNDNIFYIKKWAYILTVLSVNVAGCVFVYYFNSLDVIVYVILALKSKDLVMSVIFTFNMLYKHLFTNLSIPTVTVTDEIKRVVAFVPAYTESIDQLTKTVDSIFTNAGSPNYIMTCIVADGCERDYSSIIQNILSIKYLSYRNWLGNEISTKVLYGTRHGHHIMMIQKTSRVGKKDSIILVNDLFNRERQNIDTVNKNFQEQVSLDILTLFGISSFDYLFSTDADTIIDPNTIVCLTDSIRKRNAIAVCGVVNVDKSSGNWFWNNLQNYQYLYGQYTRRTTEDLVNQVLCLPGCISMFLLCNRTIGAQQLYSEIPDTSDLTVSNVQYVGTDRRYTSSLIYSDSSSKIVMDTRCHAYTVPPQSIAAYISQRRRWCQNTYFNTMINIIAPNVNFMLRVFCLVDYLRLSLVYFRLFNTLFFIYILATNFHVSNVTGLIPYIVVLTYPTIVFFLYSIFNGHLRAEWFNMAVSYLFNKVFIMISNVAIFTIMLWNIGSDSWSSQASVPLQMETVVTEN
jgi:cellulose synthase/poly-beta-1,6-N-acetylglucosamine synthase-like glycosyltransferase